MKPTCLIDISRLLDRASQGRLPTGIDRVCLAYVERWGGQAQAVLQKGNWRRVLSHAQSQQLFSLLLSPPAGFNRLKNRAIAAACMPPWPSQDAGGRIGFYLGHTGLEAPGFAAWLRKSRQRPVYFVHDLIPQTHPEYCRPGEQAAHVARLTTMLQSGAGIVANSGATLDSLQHFASGLQLPMPPAVVAHLAPAVTAATAVMTGPADANLQMQPELDLPDVFFVVLGTLEPRKNHLMLLNVWRELGARLGAATPHLFVIGRRGWECENAVDMLERCEPIRPFVHEIPACPDPALRHYLQGARALLFPSFAEGYGMPLVEALALGTPVIASDLPVFAEIAGAVPDLLNPIDGLGWLEAVHDFAAPQSARRAAQLERLRGLEIPTWERHFEQVQVLLEQIA